MQDDAAGMSAAPDDPTVISIGTPPSPPRSKPPKRIGRYELRELIGRGGMGDVWKAWDTALARPVALKLLHSSASKSFARFRREANLIASLSHPRIAQLYEFSADPPYIAMQYIEGVTLDRAGPDRFVALRDAALGVHEAHVRGIFHRDLKPQNIMVDAKGLPYVLDFGLARREDQDENLSRTGELLGTPSYMAPEQANGEARLCDARTDVYGLGATLYFLLTGRPPHEGSSAYSIVRKVIEDDPRPPEGERDLACIALKALEKDPARRYQSAQAFADDLTRHFTHQTIIARPASLSYRLRKRMRRHPVATFMAGLLGLVVLAAALFITSQWLEQKAMIAELELRVGLERYGRELRGLETRLMRRLDEDERSATERALLELERELSQASAAAPDEPALVFLRAEACRLLHREDAALEAYGRCLAMPPSDWSRGTGVRALAAYARARLRLAANVEHLLDHSASRAVRKKRALLEGVLPEVDADLALAGREAPPFLRVLAGLWGDFARGADSLVVACARAEVARGGSTADFYLLLGLALPEESTAARLAAYDGCLERDWNRPGVLLRRATVRIRIAAEAGRARHRVLPVGPDTVRLHAALADLDAAVRLRPRFPSAHCNRGYVLTLLGREQEALDAIDQALALRPGFSLAYLNRANLLIERGAFEAALDDLDAALGVEPDFVGAWFNRGHAWVGLGHDEAARADFEQALALDPEFPAGWLEVGLCWYRLGRPERALEHLERAIALRPDFAEALVSIGQIQAELGAWEEALRTLDAAIASDPGVPEAWYNRASVHHERDDPARAIADLDTALRLRPAFPEALLNRGLAHDAQGALARAHADYSAALQLRPDYVEALVNRADVGLELRRFDQVEQDLAAALALVPDSVPALVNRASLRVHQGRFAEVLADCERLAVLAPDLPEAWFHRGRALLELGELDLALAAYDRLLELWDEHVEGYHNRAIVHMARGDLAAARADCDAALALGGSLPATLTNRGLIAMRLSDGEAARADFLAALAADPDHLEAHLQLGQLALAERRAEEAWHAFDAVLAARPDDGEVLILRARASALGGDVAGAFADFDAAERAAPELALVFYYRGMLHRALGDSEAAVAALRRYLAHEPGDQATLFLLVQTRLDRGQTAAAVEELDALLALHPEHSGLLRFRASLHLDLGQPGPALADVERLLEVEPDDPGHLALRGDVHAALGQRAAAREDYERSLALAPDAPFAPAVREALTRLEGAEVQ